ncbi:MAG TPA: SusD/RagB family nutrient-binding outer membrane lipoprotein, partial [Paludibacter sp.]|nr:SusD/RagB family nutrient-binding outer membrane lipoprotein [Paludibacter sp.]
MKKIYLFLIFPLVLTGCTKWLDINDDPNNPKDIPMSMLLPEIERTVAATFNAGTGIGQDLGVYTHQLSTRESANEYGVGGNEYYLNESWNFTYINVLQNIDMLLKKAETENSPYYSGIAKILKAYTFSEYVDIFGDLPFSQANKKSEGILYPTFDKDSDIYPQLIELLDNGIADFDKDKGAIFPGSDDLIFSGSKTKWVNTANTIKLKMYNQLRLVDTSVKGKIEVLLSENKLISSTGDGFMFPYSSQRTPFDERNPAMVDLYEATQKSTHMSPWFFEILKGINPVFKDIVDPRIPYYFYNQLNNTQTGKDGNQFEYRVGGFATIYFGSKGPDRDKSQDKSFSVYGIYPCGGRYD